MSQLQRKTVFPAQGALELHRSEQIEGDLRHSFAEQASGPSFISQPAPPQKDPEKAGQANGNHGRADEQGSGELGSPRGEPASDGEHQKPRRTAVEAALCPELAANRCPGGGDQPFVSGGGGGGGAGLVRGWWLGRRCGG